MVIDLKLKKICHHIEKLVIKFRFELSKTASNLNLRDTQSGFRAYSKKAIEKINFNSDGFVADSEILIDASRKKPINL